MKIKGEPIVDSEASRSAGDSADVDDEFTFLLVPVTTYKIIAEMAKKEGCTAAQIFQNALIAYAKSRNAMPEASETLKPKPDFVLRKRIK